MSDFLLLPMIALVGSCAYSIYRLAGQPLAVAHWIHLLNVAFLCTPGFLASLGVRVWYAEWAVAAVARASEPELTRLFGIVLLGSACWFVGVLLGEFIFGIPQELSLPTAAGSTHARRAYRRHARRVTVTGLLIAYAFTAYYLARGNVSLIEFVMPDRVDKADAFGSHSLMLAYVFFPVALFAYLMRAEGKLTWRSLAVALTAAALALAPGQRRLVLAAVLALIGFAVVFADRNSMSPRVVMLRLRRRWGGASRLMKAAILISSVGALGPLLWWLRNLSNQIQSSGVVIAPWERRDFLTLLFRGSAATGFPIMTIISDYIAVHGTQWKSQILFLAALAVPRRLWTDKPVNLDVQLQIFAGLDGNPSSFLVGEFLLMFGPVGFTLALIAAGCGVHAFQIRQLQKGTYSRIVGVLMFANGFALFKNGAVPYLVAVAFATILTWVVFRCFRPRLERSRRPLGSRVRPEPVRWAAETGRRR